MFSLAFSILNGLVMAESSQIRKGSKSYLLMNESIAIKLCESTIQLTTFGVVKTPSVLGKRSNIMMLARETDGDGPGPETPLHPFEYAQIIGIFHVDVVHRAPGEYMPTTTSIELLWVRRYRFDTTYSAGFQKKLLYRLEFLPSSDYDAFGFVHPDEVIRGAHLIPAFDHAGTDQFLKGTSLARNEDELDDYRYFYVNM